MSASHYATPEERKLFSVVVPIYKSELNVVDTVEYIHERRDMFPGYEMELILVNDGSPDNSWQKMLEMQRKYPGFLRIASFTRNFGQSAAINCGMTLAKGSVIGVISADLQDPFELFGKMLELHEEGNELVYAKRQSREEKGLGGLASRLMHRLVHKFINRGYPTGGFDFFLVGRKLAKEYLAADRVPGGMQLLLLWFGYQHAEIPYHRAERKKGKSSWSVGKKFDAAFRWMTFFSPFLLRLLMPVGAIIVLLATVLLIVGGVVRSSDVAIAACVFIASGIVLMALGIVGEYLYRVLDFARGLPRYVIRTVVDATGRETE